MAPAVPNVFDSAVGKKQQAEARKYCEDALESFLSRLPSWRGGHRDTGRYIEESDKGGARRGKSESSSSKSRSRSRRRRGDKDKDKKKEKDKKRDRRRDRSRSQDVVVAAPVVPVKSGPNFTSEPAPVPQPSLMLPASLPPSMPGAPPPGGPPIPDWLSDIVPKGLPVGTGIRGPAHREVLVPQQYVSRLIGKGGETIMGICHQTGADVKLRQETKELGYSLAVITGRPEMVDIAERMVMEKLALVGGRLAGTPVVAPVSF